MNNEKQRIIRFTPAQRLFHLLLMISFLILSATGLSRLYITSEWGKWMAGLFGGYDTALVVHKYTGFIMIGGFLLHSVYLLTKVNFKNLTGPDSILPRGRDISEFGAHIGWFLGLKQMPRFDRWGYWEKFDYWAVFWGMVIIGVTGVMMAFPLVATRYMPGWGLNVALWIHRIEAFLAMAHVFIIHFFIAHLRPHSFPMDRTMFEGSADLEAVKIERASWVHRMKSSGVFEKMLVDEVPAAKKAVFLSFGYAMVGIGVFLLVGAVLNWQAIAW